MEINEKPKFVVNIDELTQKKDKIEETAKMFRIIEKGATALKNCKMEDYETRAKIMGLTVEELKAYDSFVGHAIQYYCSKYKEIAEPRSLDDSEKIIEETKKNGK